jgi:hypothetical protein
MSADRTSGVVDADVETEANGGTRSEATETNTGADDGPESTEVDSEKSTAKDYNGPFESREEEFAARRESRKAVAVYNDVPDEKPEDGGTGFVQSVDKPVTGETKHEAGQNVTEPPAAVEGVESPDATMQEPLDRAASESGQPETAESKQDDRPRETPRPGSYGEQPPSVEKAEASSDAEVGTQPSADFGSPLPGEEHIPLSRVESRAQTAAANAELQNGEQDAGRTTEAVGRPTEDAIGGIDTPDGWPDHVDNMKAEWAKHESRWPGEGPAEGSPPDREPPDEGVRGESAPAERPEDEPGSWRGDGGQYLNREENYSVGRTFDRVMGSEGEVTDMLRGHEIEAVGTKLVGLKYRLKGQERFKEKVAEQLAVELREDPRAAAEATPDAIRYTYQIPTTNYTHEYNRITGSLEKDGHERLLVRNSWKDSQYKGINTRWQTTEGQIFEVQFHTPESFEAKQLTHGAYERLRSPTTSHTEKRELQLFQKKTSEAIPTPGNVDNISNYRKDGY